MPWRRRRARANYLDVTAEQASARATYEEFDEPARASGVLVVPGHRVLRGFADLSSPHPPPT